MPLKYYRGEDYESMYGSLNYENKVVLDVGADYGSTAAFFLKKGAKQIIAVEGSLNLRRNLRINAKILKSVIAINMWITHPKHFETLITTYHPDIVKVDCEGCETNLFKISNIIFNQVPEYIIETHSNTLQEELKEKCKENNYECALIVQITQKANVFYCKAQRF